jgi:hypothetical protein
MDGGGERRAPARLPAHRAQSSHQDPAVSVAAARQFGADGAYFSAASYRALGSGGLTIPAICPPELSTYRTSPPSRRVA